MGGALNCGHEPNTKQIRKSFGRRISGARTPREVQKRIRRRRYHPAEPWREKLADGTVVAMAGANKEHVTVGVNLTGEIGGQIKGSPCRVYNSNMRTRVIHNNANAYRYPDLSVACDPEFEFDVLLNPTVLVEIASSSTEVIDRSRKWNQYRLLPSLQDYVLISPTQVMVEQRHRADDGQQWWVRVLESLEDELVLDSINCRVALADIYSGIALETEALEAPTSNA